MWGLPAWDPASLFGVGSSSDFQREALISAPSALSLFKTLTWISLRVPPTVDADTLQRHLSRRCKFRYFLLPSLFSHVQPQCPQLSTFCFLPTDLFVLPCWTSCVRQTWLREQRLSSLIYGFVLSERGSHNKDGSYTEPVVNQRIMCNIYYVHFIIEPLQTAAAGLEKHRGHESEIPQNPAHYKHLYFWTYLFNCYITGDYK